MPTDPCLGLGITAVSSFGRGNGQRERGFQGRGRLKMGIMVSMTGSRVKDSFRIIL